MVDSSAKIGGTVTRISVGSILIGSDHLPIDATHVDKLRSHEIVDDRHIEVRIVDSGYENEDWNQWPLYVIINGRHRFLAAVLNGATWVECVIT